MQNGIVVLIVSENCFRGIYEGASALSLPSGASEAS